MSGMVDDLCIYLWLVRNQSSLIKLIRFVTVK